MAVADAEPQVSAQSDKLKDEVIVTGHVPLRYEIISDHVAEAKTLLRDVELHYEFTGRGRSETMRGRPVAFALWSEIKQQWIIAHIEIPRPPVKWKPGGKPIPFRVITPGIQAQHVKGTGAERLMFASATER